MQLETESEGEVGVEEEVAATAGQGGASDDATAEGYDEAVEKGVPYHAEPEILAQESADPVALTEVEPFTEDELVLQEPGRDLRPDTIVPAPDITAAELASIGNLESLEEFVASEDATDQANEEKQTSAPAVLEDTASSESTDEAKQDASRDAEN